MVRCCQCLYRLSCLFFGVEVILMPKEGGWSNLSKMSTSVSSVGLNLGPPENVVKRLRRLFF